MESTSKPHPRVCVKFPVISSGFTLLFGGWAEEKKVSLPGPTGEANFADLMSFFFCSNWESTNTREGTQAAERARERPGGASSSGRGL